MLDLPNNSAKKQKSSRFYRFSNSSSFYYKVEHYQYVTNKIILYFTVVGELNTSNTTLGDLLAKT